MNLLFPLNSIQNPVTDQHFGVSGVKEALGLADSESWRHKTSSEALQGTPYGNLHEPHGEGQENEAAFKVLIFIQLHRKFKNRSIL